MVKAGRPGQEHELKGIARKPTKGKARGSFIKKEGLEKRHPLGGGQQSRSRGKKWGGEKTC